MRFLLDEDVPAEVGRVLRRAGHEVTHTKDLNLLSATDVLVFEHAVERRFTLVTCNRDDFLPLATKRQHSGLVVLIRRKSRILECAKLLHLLDTAGETGISGNINFA